MKSRRSAALLVVVAAFFALCPAVLHSQSVPPRTVEQLWLELTEPKLTRADTVQKIAALARKDPSARRYVVERLPEAIIRTEQDDPWFDAIRVATDLRAPETVAALIQAMSLPPRPAQLAMTFTDVDHLSADIVGKALFKIGDPSVPAVKGLLQNPDPRIRGRAIAVLRNINSPASRKALTDRVPHETNPELKKQIQYSLLPQS